ncbi:hypothetical protein PCASD_05826 [Puccinia coronata f. sp. avenae]|uniref:Uncharacterized protein n=1 Tax=Puccinia coronata f. sp. avenae TaxID=200324 RepID=A0A2N5V1J0_9BASI|nr:hypothetical protein PCASD_05826 [Puccinia coronata f. sp. avenae]
MRPELTVLTARVEKNSRAVFLQAIGDSVIRSLFYANVLFNKYYPPASWKKGYHQLRIAPIGMKLDYVYESAVVKRSTSLKTGDQLVHGCTIHHVSQSVPVPTATRQFFHPLPFHQQSGSSKLSNFKDKAYQQIEGTFGRAYSPGGKILWTYDGGIIDAEDVILSNSCTDSLTLDHDAEIYQWCLEDSPFAKDSAHEQPSGPLRRRYQLFMKVLSLEEHFDPQDEIKFLSRCSLLSEFLQPDQVSEWIASPAVNVVSPSESVLGIRGKNTSLDFRGEGILSSTVPRILSVERRSLLSQNSQPKITTVSPEVVPQLNAVNYPAQSVEATSITQVSKPQGIILAFGLIILLSLIMVVSFYVRGRIERRKKSSTRSDIPTIQVQPSSFNSVMGHPSHPVTIEPHTRSSSSFLGNDDSELKSDPSQPAHCEFGILHPIQTHIASERLSDVTPPLDLLQRSENQIDKQPQKDGAVHTSSSRAAASVTASTTSIKQQTAEEAIPSDLDCTEDPRGTLTRSTECSQQGSRKSTTPSINQAVDFLGFNMRDMEAGSCEIQSSPTSLRERSATTASSVRTRSYVVAEKLSSILRPVSTNFSGDSSSKPLPLKRLKKSFGVGEDSDSDEEQDQAALSDFFRRQYAQWSAGQLAAGVESNGMETDSPSLSSPGFRSIEPRPLSGIFSHPSLEKCHLVSKKSLQDAIRRPKSHYSCNLTSSHNSTPSLSPTSNLPMMYETPANGATHSPDNIFFASHPQRNSRGPIAPVGPVVLSLEAPFCSSPKSLSSQSHFPKIPPPADSTYEKAYQDLQERYQNSAPSTSEAYNTKHKHSYSASMKNLSEFSAEIEPISKMKLSVTNPDVELTESDSTLRGLREFSDPSPSSRAESKSPRITCSYVQDKSIQASPLLSPVTSLHRSSQEDPGGHNRSYVQDKNIHPSPLLSPVTSLHRSSPADPGGHNRGNDRRRSWLSSSLSLRILPQSNPSMKSAALSMSPARLRKSLSIGGRISSSGMKAAHRPPDLVITRRGDPQSTRRTDVSAQADSLSSKDISRQADSQLSQQHHDPSKSSSAGLVTLLGLSSKPKECLSLNPHEYLGMPCSPSPSSDPISSSCSSYSENGPCNFFESSRAHHASYSIESCSSSHHSPSSFFDKTSYAHSNPYYSSAPHSFDDHLDQAHLAYGSAAREPSQATQWKSRLNSVGSFIEVSEDLHESTQSCLVIANPDMTHPNEASSIT